MIRAIALDDEPPALRVLENFCKKTVDFTLLKTFVKPSEATHYIHNFPIDLLFLDVDMPSISGIEFYKSLEMNVPVIFTTAHTQYAIDGFNLNAVDYLLKPYTYERFLQAIQKYKILQTAVSQSPTPPQYLYIRADYTLHKIPFEEIIYIEAFDDYVKIFVDNAKTIVSRSTVKAILEKLPAENFIRVHRSYVVNVKYLTSIRNKIISINGIDIPIGNKFESDLTRYIKL